MSKSFTKQTQGLPPAQGLYHPSNERDACGIGFVVNIQGQKSHDIVLKGIQVLINLTHRGACGCDPETGDGAGVTIQIPHTFFSRECAKLGFTLPPAGEYGIARRRKAGFQWRRRSGRERRIGQPGRRCDRCEQQSADCR